MELETIAQVQVPSKVMQPDESTDAAVVWNSVFNCYNCFCSAPRNTHAGSSAITELCVTILSMTDSFQQSVFFL